MGEFQSVRARNNLKPNPIIQQKHNEKQSKTISNDTQAQTVKNPQIEKQRVNNIISEMQTSIEKAINHALQQIPVEFSHERTM